MAEKRGPSKQDKRVALIHIAVGAIGRQRYHELEREQKHERKDLGPSIAGSKTYVYSDELEITRFFLSMSET